MTYPIFAVEVVSDATLTWELIHSYDPVLLRRAITRYTKSHLQQHGSYKDILELNDKVNFFLKLKKKKYNFFFFWGTLFLRKLYLKNFNIKNKDNKINMKLVEWWNDCNFCFVCSAYPWLDLTLYGRNSFFHRFSGNNLI